MNPNRLTLLALLFAGNLCSASQLPPAPVPTTPGIFGIGFTNVTDTSARLVFTTSEPMTSTVTVLDHDREIARVKQDAFDEIHAVDLPGLTKGVAYQVSISCVSHDGKSVVSAGHALTPAQRSLSGHTWPGYTIFSTSITGKSDADFDLLAQSGVRMMRIEASWSGLYPTAPDKLNQSYLNELTALAAKLKSYNIEPLVVLDYCTPWAKPYTATTMTWRNTAFGPPDRLEDWDQYVRTVVTALHGSAKYYEIWNEPDAGYLATGSYVERPNVPVPIGRPPFKDNWHYWLGDRFVPMIQQVRKVMDDLEPNAILLNGGWNRDYPGERGDLLLERGVAPSLDVYAFHCYSAPPLSFARWYGAIDGGFRKSIDRNFEKHHVQMPLAVTEWGWPAWSDPQAGKGFVTFADAQKFFVKSTFYFLAMQRVEILSQFCLGIGPTDRSVDPSFFSLVDTDASGKTNSHPSYATFQWLATTFGSKPYRALPVQVAPPDHVKAYALQMKNSGDIYLAAWQDGVPNDKGEIAALPALEVAITLADAPDATYTVTILGLDGAEISQSPFSASHGLQLKTMLPEISATAESGIYLVKISHATK